MHFADSIVIFLLALVGGWLGVLFMIPLRRQLIVEEHGTLTYPEGTACADVLIAGDRGGSDRSRDARTVERDPQEARSNAGPYRG